MFNWKRRYTPLLLILLIFAISFPSFSQESTEEPAPVVTEVIPPTVEVPPTEEAIVTEEAVPTEEIVPTEEAVPTEEIIVPTEEVLPTEETAPVLDVTEEPTAEAPIPTAAPEETISHAPSGNAVEMLLQYNPASTDAAVQSLLSSLGAIELERLPQIGVIRVLIPGTVSNLASAQSHLQSSNIAATSTLTGIEPVIIYQLSYTPNDALFLTTQTNLIDETNGGAPYSINMQTGWDVSTRDGQGVTVAVIDSGVDLQHPDLQGRLVAGWDFFNDDNNPDEFDDDGIGPYVPGHGTHVAGVIAARTNNGLGVAGIAYNSLILPVKVCGSIGCPSYEIAAGIVFAVDRGAKVINISLGGPVPSTTIEGAINYALSRNVVVVVAAGNDGDGLVGTPEISYPAYHDGVISVGALNPNGSLATFSNTNDNVTVSAPGFSIVSTFPIDTPPYSFVALNGTSMAAPHVSGLAALIIADGIATTPATVRDALICGARDLDSNGYDNGYGYGLITAAPSLNWDNNSGSCQISQPNDEAHTATAITSPSTRTQPVNLSSVTENAGDPESSCAPDLYQSLWYKFTPTTAGIYHFSTLGSNYDTVLTVYAGQPGALTELACSDDTVMNMASQLSVSLNKSVTYYVMIASNGSATTGLAQLNVNAPIPSILQQENAVGIRYTGTWNRIARTGTNGGFINTTTDASATASFLVRGTNLNLTRLVGPDQGEMDVWIDGTMTTVDNSGAITRSQMISIPLGGETGSWHLVIIMKCADTLPISIDAIQGTDNPLPTSVVSTTRANDRSLNFFSYLGGAWSVGSSSNFFGNDASISSATGAYVQFRATGSAITIFRATGQLGSNPEGGMNIYLDNEFYAFVDNGALPDGHSVPYSIANLPPRERIVRIESDGTNNLTFDGAQAITQGVLAVGPTYDERHPSIIYSGIWLRENVAGTQGNTLSTTYGDAEVEFMFSGNHLCIGFRRNTTNGAFNIFIDDVAYGTVSTYGTLLYKTEWCTYNANINTLTDTVHSVRLEAPTFSGTILNIDFVRPVRRTVFTSAMGYITETNPDIIYNTAYGAWTTNGQRSIGGYSFQGGSARRANVGATLGTQPRLNFTMNGTGFILYTSLPLLDNVAAWQVYVDGSATPFNTSYQGATIPFIPLLGYTNRFIPAGIGVIELSPGIHNIELRAVRIAIETAPGVFFNPTSPFVDFDGIRVLP